MNAAAKAVVSEHPDIVIAYGISDEYRYIFISQATKQEDSYWSRHLVSYSTNHAVCLRDGQGMTPLIKFCVECWYQYSKIVTTISSTFTAYYVHLWNTFFSEQPLTAPLPSFDGRAVMYPTVQNLRDYMSWRQVDCKCVRSGCGRLGLRTRQVISTICTIPLSGRWYNRVGWTQRLPRKNLL